MPLKSLLEHLLAGAGLAVFLADFPGASRERAEAAIVLAKFVADDKKAFGG